MPRKPRIHYTGAVYHVMLRGNAKQNIFFKKYDKFKLSFLLQESAEKYSCKIHAFCFMSNHIHLAIQVDEQPLSKFIQYASSRYTRWVNKQNNRVGHLFQARFKAILVDSDVYLTELTRYIHLNPVRAKIVSHPNDYFWSSHSDYIKLTKTPWVTKQLVLSKFSNKKSVAIKLYKQYINESIFSSHQDKFHMGKIDKRILGEKDFIEDVIKNKCERSVRLVAKIEDIFDYICKNYSVTKNELISPSRSRVYSEPRALIVWLAAEFGSTTLTGASKLFNKDVTQFIRKIKYLQRYKSLDLKKIKEDFNKSIS